MRTSRRPPVFSLIAMVVVAAMALAACGGSSSTKPDGTGTCNPACSEGRDCCADQCVNLQNDPQNCGSCGRSCADGTICTGGTCVTRPCSTSCGDPASCCGSECCAAGELCCDPQGPVAEGPTCLAPSDQGTCPAGCAPLCICASPDTPIATPFGDRPIASLQVGDLVYSIDRGALEAVSIVRTNRVAVSNHHVVQVTLGNGSTLEISGGHPTADGRRFDELRRGDSLGGVVITGVRTVPYSSDSTYDILPGSDTGAYYAGGALVGSTLVSMPVLVPEP